MRRHKRHDVWYMFGTSFAVNLIHLFPILVCPFLFDSRVFVQDMGFSRPDAERALGLSGGSLSGALRLLTT
jgi:hypothetical protein